MLVLLRRLRRDPLTSAVNILGLAVALAAVLLMALYIRFESSFDNFFPDGDRIWRLGSGINQPGGVTRQLGHVPNQITGVLNAEHADIEAIARASQQQDKLIQPSNAELDVGYLLVDPNFLEVLRFPLLEGAPAETALAAPGTAVVTESLAAKLEGDGPVVGREITLRGQGGRERAFKITAVMADVPRNSHFGFDALVAEAGRDQSWADQAEQMPSVWDSMVYLRLRPGTDIDALEEETAQGMVRLIGGPRPDGSRPFEFTLYPLRGIHLSGLDLLSLGAVDPQTLWLMAGIAALVLAVAVVNSTNLMTAQALRRGVEVGIRKTLGAGRGRLMREFLAESITITALATLLALALVEALMDPFSQLVQRDDLSWSLLPPVEAGAIIAGVAIGAGLLGGFYPALVMARWRPDDVFRGRGGPVGASWLRSLLVVAQFAIAIGLIIATVTVLRQVEHARGSTLAATPETLMLATISNIRGPVVDGQPQWIGPTPQELETLRTELLRDPRILGIALSSAQPADAFGPRPEEVSIAGRPEKAALFSISADPEYLSVYDIPILAGESLATRPRPAPAVIEAEAARNGELMRAAREARDAGREPDPPKPEDARTYPAILSAEAARVLGFASPADAVGALLTATPTRSYQVIGVAADNTWGTASDPRRAVIYHMAFADQWHRLTIRIAAGDPRGAREFVEQTAQAVFGRPRTHIRFLDEVLEQTYRREIRQARIFATFGGLAILLACTGLFALTALAAARRTREIGIRRVMGAGIGDIVRLLVGEFARPVLAANIVALPVAWLLLSRWLEQYAVRVDPGWHVYVGAGSGVLVLAAVTVALHAARVALAPPVRALRTE